MLSRPSSRDAQAVCCEAANDAGSCDGHCCNYLMVGALMGVWAGGPLSAAAAAAAAAQVNLENMNFLWQCRIAGSMHYTTCKQPVTDKKCTALCTIQYHMIASVMHYVPVHLAMHFGQPIGLRWGVPT
jgi:hypothetical protein